MAVFFPRSFYDDFPTVRLDPPYNEHLVSDVGGLGLALSAMLVIAAVVLERTIALAALTGYAIYAATHFAFHVRHFEHFAARRPQRRHRPGPRGGPGPGLDRRGVASTPTCPRLSRSGFPPPRFQPPARRAWLCASEQADVGRSPGAVVATVSTALSGWMRAGSLPKRIARSRALSRSPSSFFMPSCSHAGAAPGLD
ncbi:hypothetical protein [Paractinoplanes durhamensis]|uniref:hypothetical protein n=1 Tax=Paractinoplanes durhamensis TaxID=113563 RepID=UPI003626BA23